MINFTVALVMVVLLKGVRGTDVHISLHQDSFLHEALCTFRFFLLTHANFQIHSLNKRSCANKEIKQTMINMRMFYK